MTNTPTKFLPIALLTLLVTPSHAETSVFNLSLEELLQIQIVSAAGYAQPIGNASATVSILHAEEWQARGARTLNDAISILPGVHIAKTQTGVAKDKVMLRGISGNFGEQILILMDGIPLRTIHDSGVFYGQRIPLTGFKRIEVIKDPGSAIYGADAMGGVINLISYAPGELPSDVAMRYGDFDTTDVAMRHHFSWGESTFQVAFDYQHSNDDPDKIVNSDLQSTLDQIIETNVSKAPGRFDEHYEMYALKAQWTLGRMQLDFYDWNNLESGVGAGVAQALDPAGSAKQRNTSYDLNVDLSSDTETQTDLHLAYKEQKLNTEYYIFPAGSRLPIGPDGNVSFSNSVNFVTFTDGFRGNPGIKSYNYAASLTQNLQVNDNNHVRWEVGAQRTKSHATETKNFGPGVLDAEETTIVNGTLTNVTNTPYVYLPDSHRDIYFLSLQDEWVIHPSLRATLGLRYDHYSDFGDTTNPRLSLIWSQSKALSFKLFAGSAFRAPSFIDLYTQNNPAALGNSDLEPEKIQTLDSGLALHYFSGDNLTLDLNVFQFKAENLIEYTAGTHDILTSQNVGEQHGKGLELSGQWRAFEHWTLNFNYSYINSTDKDGEDTPDVPEQMANLNAHWTPQPRIHLYLGAKWVADRARASTDNRAPLDDYIWGTAKAEYRLNTVSISMSADNLFDVEAKHPSDGRIPNDYPLAGRQLMMELRYRF